MFGPLAESSAPRPRRARARHSSSAHFASRSRRVTPAAMRVRISPEPEFTLLQGKRLRFAAAWCAQGDFFDVLLF